MKQMTYIKRPFFQRVPTKIFGIIPLFEYQRVDFDKEVLDFINDFSKSKKKRQQVFEKIRPHMMAFHGHCSSILMSHRWKPDFNITVDFPDFKSYFNS